MSIEFRCDQCGRLLRVGDDAVGRLAQCPACGTQKVVPATSSTPAAIQPEIVRPTSPPAPSVVGRYDLFSHTPPDGAAGSSASARQPVAATGLHGLGQSNNRATTSLALGVLSLGLCLFGPCCGGYLVLLAIPTAISGMVMGVMALGTGERLEAVLGILFSLAALVASVIALLAYFVFFAGNALFR